MQGGDNNPHWETCTRACQCAHQTCFLYLPFCFISYFKRSQPSLLGYEKRTLQQTNRSFCHKRISEVQGFSKTQDTVGKAVCPFKHYKKWKKANYHLSLWHNDCNLRGVMITSKNLRNWCIWQISPWPALFIPIAQIPHTKNFPYTMKQIVYNVTGYIPGTALAPGSTKLIPGILGTI